MRYVENRDSDSSVIASLRIIKHCVLRVGWAFCLVNCLGFCYSCIQVPGLKAVRNAWSRLFLFSGPRFETD